MIEEQLWAKLVQPYLAASPTAKLPKKEQQGLASALQDWTAGCISSRLEDIVGGQLKKGWQIQHKGKDFLGAVSLCSVGGVIAFPDWTASEDVLKQMVSICSRSIPRERALNAYGKFEGFALFTDNGDRPGLSPGRSFFATTLRRGVSPAPDA